MDEDAPNCQLKHARTMKPRQWSIVCIQIVSPMDYQQSATATLQTKSKREGERIKQKGKEEAGFEAKRTQNAQKCANASRG